VDTRYPKGMSAEHEVAFKLAFVVFVMSTLFVPGAKHDYVHVDYWGALSDPNCIHQFDWLFINDCCHQLQSSSPLKTQVAVHPI
jgi:hypothetical protein